MAPPYDLATVFAAHIQTAESEATRVYEAAIAVVTDNKDPSKLGRVKVKIPILSEQDATWWAPIVMIGAGKNRGWFFIPEIDDEVLVMFEHGDINRPVVVGAMWNGKDKPHDNNSDGKNARRVIKSRGGSKITFDDDQMKIIIEDGGNIGRITIDANAKKITIEALDGDVCFQSPTGDMKIVAKSAELKAGQKLQVHAGDKMAWGTDATAKVKGGSVTLTGSTVKLNGGGAQAPAAPTSDPQDIPDPYGS
jgi:uncharacterized protein involved in type VI secretion and phage assembly